MLQEFTEFIELEGLFKPMDQILLGVSGGVDSVVMVDLFSKAGFNFGIAHCNFGLRGQESEEDSSFVKLLAQKYNVSFYTKKFNTLTYSENNSISIQMAARELRIKWFEEIILSQGYDCYATAHHLDDQIETILNNFFRGTGISGLHGILPKRDFLIHPMLFYYRKQIEVYANQNQLRYRTDSSNAKTEYTRNQIRHRLIPIVKQIFPNYQKIISDNAFRISQVESIYKQHIQQIVDELTEKNKDYLKISIEKLLKLQPVEMYLYELIKPLGFNYTDAIDLVRTFNSNSGKYFVSQTHKITKDRKHLIIDTRSFNENNTYLIEKDEKKLLNPIKLTLEIQNITSDFKISKNPKIAHFDYDKLKFPLKLRKWQKGDYFYPLGMHQKKLVSDFFVDNKVSVPDKDKAWILTSDEQIVWIVGYRIDDRFKVCKNTLAIAIIEYNDQ